MIISRCRSYSVTAVHVLAVAVLLFQADYVHAQDNAGGAVPPSAVSPVVNPQTDAPLDPADLTQDVLTQTVPVAPDTLTQDILIPEQDLMSEDLATPPLTIPAGNTENISPEDAFNASIKAGTQERLTAEEIAAAEEKATADTAEQKSIEKSINLLELVRQGGVLMYPIIFLSVFGLMFALERLFALSRFSYMPGRLRKDATVALSRSQFNPRELWKICEHHRSALGRIMQAMLMKAGRPLPEIEKAEEEAKQEEAVGMYSNVRWIVLVATLAPLLGLLGTVWGMIEAFFITANMPTGANRAEDLAGGIYVALVTTAAGLVVAIPAALIAHWYEGKIQNAFTNMDDLLLRLKDRLEEMESQERFTYSRYMD